MHTIRAILATLLLTSLLPANADVSGDPEKLPGFIVALETDATGAAVRGSLSRLIRSVRAGAEIKIMHEGPSLTQTFSCDSTIIYESGPGVEQLACAVLNRATLIDEASLPAFVVRSSPYFTRYVYSTSGDYTLMRTTFTGSNIGSTTGTQLALTWFAQVR